MTEIEKVTKTESRTTEINKPTETEIENYQVTIDELLEQVEALSARCNFAESRLQKYDGIEEMLHKLENDYESLKEVNKKLEQELTDANNRADTLGKMFGNKLNEVTIANNKADAWKKVVRLELFEK